MEPNHRYPTRPPVRQRDPREDRLAGYHVAYEPPAPPARSRLSPDMEADGDGGFWGFFFALLIGCAVVLIAALAFAPFLQIHH